MNSRFDVQPIGEMSPPLTLSHSAILSAEKPFVEAAGFGVDIVPQLNSEQTRKRIADKLDVINQSLQDPRLGFGQKSLDYVSQIASSMGALGLFAYFGAEAGAGAAGIAGAGMELTLPEAVLSFGRTPISKLATGALSDYLPSLSAAELAKGIAGGYGAYKGMTIPEHVVENYHKDTDTLDARTVIKDWAHDNFGFLLPAPPLAAGYLLYKVFSVGRGAKEAATMARAMVAEHEIKTRARQTQIQFAKTRAQKAAYEAAEEARRETGLEKAFNEALEKGTITPAEHKWYQNYLASPDDIEGHSQDALGILKDTQFPIDRATGRVWFEILGSKDIKQLKQAITDQVGSNFSKEEQSALSDYITHNGMDIVRANLSNNPHMLMALKGYTDFIDKKLGSKVKALQKLDAILESHGARGLKKNELFSEESIYKHLKKMGVTHAEEVPYTLPENVSSRLTQDKKIKLLIDRNASLFKQYEKTGDQSFVEQMKENNKEIEEINKNLKIFHTSEEELQHLKSQLIKNKGLVKNFKNKKAYHRLEELADVWANAKHLLDRIHLEHEYGKQEAFNNVLKDFINLVDSSAQRLASPSRVVNYMKKRIESAAPKIKEFEPKKPVAAKIEKGTEGKPNVLSQEKESVKKSTAESLKNEFVHEDDRYRTFKDNQEILKRMIKCAWGKLNG